MMKPNDLLFSPEGKDLLRVLQIQNENVLVIDCSGKSMPNWVLAVKLKTYTQADETAIYERWKLTPVSLDDLTPKQRKKALEHYTVISGVLAVLPFKQERDRMISIASDRYQISKQTVRTYLKKYLIFQDVTVLAPVERPRETVLTQDQKNIRRALNKFYYTQHQNSLTTAYTMMLKERYTDADGIIFLCKYQHRHVFFISFFKYFPGHSQEKLCAELQHRGFEIGRTTYAKYESGELNIRVSVLIELKNIYDCSYDDFFDGLYT